MRRDRKTKIPTPVWVPCAGANLPFGSHQETSQGGGRRALEMKVSESIAFSGKPRAPCTVPQRDETPKYLPGNDGPEAGSEQRTVVMARDQQNLISGDQPDHARVPSAERRTAMMVRHSVRNVYSGKT